jgi:Tol biopolymer transport system component
MVEESLFEEAGRIGVRMESAEHSVAPGGQVVVPVVLTNQGDVADDFDLFVRGIPANWLWVASPVVHLAPSEEREVNLVVQPPRYPQGRAGSYPFTVRVSSQEDPQEAVEVEARLTVAALEVPGRIGVLMAATEFSVAPGGSVTVPIVVANQGLEPDAFELSATGIPAGWVTMAEPAVRLRPGEQQEVGLTIQPPRAGQSRAGRHLFQVHVKSLAVPGQAAEAECTLTVGVFSEFDAALQPEQVEAGETAWVRVENRGNAQATYTVTWESPNDALTFEPAGEGRAVPDEAGAPSPRPAVPVRKLRVPAGEMSTLEFTAAPRVRPLVARETAHPYTVRVESAERETRNLSGQVVGQGLIPMWLAVAAVALGFVLVFACMFIVFADRIQSQNAAATQTVVAYETAMAEYRAAVATPVPTEAPTEVPPAEAPTDVPPAPTEVPPTPVPSEVPPTPVPTEVPPTPVPPTPPPDLPIRNQGRIAFESNRDGDPEIYVFNTADLSLSRLTISPGLDTQATWSPDGTQVAFVTDRDGNFEVYVMNADGSDVVNFTRNPAADTYPAWSNDGEWIAFTSDRDGNQEVYIARPDGSDLANVTNNPANDYQPSWAASGFSLLRQQYVAFTTDRDGHQEIYKVQLTGTQTNLTNSPAQDYQPAYAPDGGRLLFTSNRDGNQEIYRMRDDGTDQVNLSNNPAQDFFPAWSPDGQWVAFTTDRDGNPEIYVMKSDGTEPYNLTNDPATDLYPAWVK